MVEVYSMSLSTVEKERFYETLDYYVEHFPFVLSQINKQKGKHMVPSEPYAIIGDYLKIQSILNENKFERASYKEKLEHLIKDLRIFRDNISDYESVLMNDIQHFLNECNRFYIYVENELADEKKDLSDAFNTLETHVFRFRDSFEYIRMGIEYTKHFQMPSSILGEVERFDSKLFRLLSRIRTQHGYNKLVKSSSKNYTKRFWWRLID